MSIDKIKKIMKFYKGLVITIPGYKNIIFQYAAIFFILLYSAVLIIHIRYAKTRIVSTHLKTKLKCAGATYHLATWQEAHCYDLGTSI